MRRLYGIKNSRTEVREFFILWICYAASQPPSAGMTTLGGMERFVFILDTSKVDDDLFYNEM
jgi:hypothetical protein